MFTLNNFAKVLKLYETDYDVISMIWGYTLRNTSSNRSSVIFTMSMGEWNPSVTLKLLVMFQYDYDDITLDFVFEH